MRCTELFSGLQSQWLSRPSADGCGATRSRSTIGLTLGGSAAYPLPGTPANGIHVWNFKTHTGSILAGCEGCYWPAWSPNGKWLMVLRPNGNLMRYSPITKTWTEFGDIHTSFNWWTWSRDSKFIYYTANEGIYRIPLGTGKSELFASFKDIKLPANDTVGIISMTPDNMPAIMSDTSVQQIYSLEWKK